MSNNIWILTVGNSDVQLNTKDHWNHLTRKVKNDLPNSDFELNKHRSEANFRVPARVLGLVYSNQLNEYGEDLHFSLLDILSAHIAEEAAPDRIYVLLTDQENVFTPSEKRVKRCRYWRDTVTLKPILEWYFAQKFPCSQVEFLILKPESPAETLEGWKSAAQLVNDAISSINIDGDDTVYVSQSAATPPVASAMQLASLKRFGNGVRFLVAQDISEEVGTFADLISEVYTV